MQRAPAKPFLYAVSALIFLGGITALEAGFNFNLPAEMVGLIGLTLGKILDLASTSMSYYVPQTKDDEG